MRKSPGDTVCFIVVPCYNENEALPESAKILKDKLNRLISDGKISDKSKIVFVDDGSTDGTWEIIEDLYSKDTGFCGLRLGNNRGHQNALLCGLMFAKDRADVAISIDADLQQDIEAMDAFLDEYYKGNEIVYGIRNNRKSDSGFKKNSASLFYHIMKLLGAKIYEDSADYRLMSKKALLALSEYTEVNLLLRGIIPDIGLKYSFVHFDVKARMQGHSKYTLKKMITLGLNGITSFSITPIHIISVLGIICMLISVGMIAFVFADWLLGNTVAGYSTILISLWFLGGLTMFSIGIVGEYVGRSYEEIKRRPRYYISEVLFKEEK